MRRILVIAGMMLLSSAGFAQTATQTRVPVRAHTRATPMSDAALDKVTAGTAEQNATALNIVNAAGGMVANAVNVARTSNMNSTPTLTQSNSISQTR